MSDKEFEGKSVLITGGGGGFGAAFSLALAERGAAVTLTDINENAGAEAVKAITAVGGQARFMLHDVTDDASWGRAVELALSEFGGLDIVINNAGVGSRMGFSETRRGHGSRLLAMVATQALFHGYEEIGLEYVDEPTLRDAAMRYGFVPRREYDLAAPTGLVVDRLSGSLVEAANLLHESCL